MHGVHKDGELAAKVKAIVQKRAMQYYNWTEEQFIEIFGKSYL